MFARGTEAMSRVGHWRAGCVRGVGAFAAPVPVAFEPRTLAEGAWTHGSSNHTQIEISRAKGAA